MTTNHTSTPWIVKPSSGGIAKGFDVMCGGNRMAFVAANPRARERAQHIADCVNQCDAAVSAIKEWVSYEQSFGDVERIPPKARAAIAKAKGE